MAVKESGDKMVVTEEVAVMREEVDKEIDQEEVDKEYHKDILDFHKNVSSHSMPSDKDHSMDAPVLMPKVSTHGPHHGAQPNSTAEENTFKTADSG